MRSEYQTVWILVILVGLIWVQHVCKAEDIITELNVTISINAINYYLGALNQTAYFCSAKMYGSPCLK